MDAETTQIFDRYLSAKGTGYASQQTYSSPPTALYFYFRFRRDDQTNRAQPTYVGKRGFNEGFEWTLKQHRYFKDI